MMCQAGHLRVQGSGCVSKFSVSFPALFCRYIDDYPADRPVPNGVTERRFPRAVIGVAMIVWV
jgi:hypothetical protein